VCTGVSVGDPRTSDQRDKDRAAGLRFVEQESETLPFPSDEHFDLIVSRMTFLHLFDPMRVLRQLYRHLEYGGEMRIHSDALVSQRVFSSNPTSDDAAAMQQVIDQLRAAGINIDVLTNAGYVVVRKPVGALDDLPLQDVYRYRALGPHEGDLYSLKQTRGKKDGA
jgi:SAM-dependent methyltransferase